MTGDGVNVVTIVTIAKAARAARNEGHTALRGAYAVSMMLFTHPHPGLPLEGEGVGRGRVLGNGGRPVLVRKKARTPSIF